MQKKHAINQNCLYGIALLAAVSSALICVCLLKRAKQKKISSKVAEEGYETAEDIHFPLKINKPGNF